MILKKNKTGFTIIEILLYVGISSIVLSSIAVFTAGMLQARVKSQTMAEVEQQGLETMQMITQTVRNAHQINSPNVGNESSSLSIDVESVDKSPTVFDSSAGKVRIKEGSGSYIALTNSRVSVSDLKFRNLSRGQTPGIIELSFHVEYINSSGRNEYDFGQDFKSSVTLRRD